MIRITSYHMLFVIFCIRSFDYQTIMITLLHTVYECPTSQYMYFIFEYTIKADHFTYYRQIDTSVMFQKY